LRGLLHLCHHRICNSLILISSIKDSRPRISLLHRRKLALWDVIASQYLGSQPQSPQLYLACHVLASLIHDQSLPDFCHCILSLDGFQRLSRTYHKIISYPILSVYFSSISLLFEFCRHHRVPRIIMSPKRLMSESTIPLSHVPLLETFKDSPSLWPLRRLYSIS
jgi:hypothetical protein